MSGTIKKYAVAVLSAATVTTAAPAFAVLSADQLAVTGALDTLISDLSTWGWTAILAVVVFMIGAKLFKKFVAKAT